MKSNNIANLTPSSIPLNEFTTIYNDSYEVVGAYDEVDSIHVALMDFAKYVGIKDLSLFWVNYVSPYQAVEYKRTVNSAFTENVFMFEVPTVLIGWKKVEESKKYYWLRLMNGKLNVVVTNNIGDIAKATDMYGKDGVTIIGQDSTRHDDEDYPDTIIVGTSIYYTIMGGISEIIDNYTKKYIATRFVDNITTITNVSKGIQLKTSVSSIDDMDKNEIDDLYEYPVCNDALDKNIVGSIVAMLHNLCKYITNEIPIDIYHNESSSALLVGYQSFENDVVLMYWLMNSYGKLSVYVESDNKPLTNKTVSSGTDTDINIPFDVEATLLAFTSKKEFLNTFEK